MRILAYNIRHGQGLDRRVAIDRIASVLSSVRPDVAGLNEVWRIQGRLDQPRYLEQAAAMTGAFQPTFRLVRVIQGNVVLSAGPLREVRDEHLPGGFQPRGCLLVETEVDDVRFRFGTLHLSLGRTARGRQLAFLAEKLPLDLPLVLAGDFNCGSAELAPLRRVLNLVADPPMTYPSSGPRKALDHVAFSSHWELTSLRTVPSDASDHLPLVAELRLR